MFRKNNKKSVWEKYPELKNIPKDRFPHHVLLIPDGNGRWAKLYGKNLTQGHKAGAEVMKQIYFDLWQLPIKFITIWGFSADNWSRTKEEANGIMHVMNEGLKTMLPEVIAKNSRIMHIGRKDRIPEYLRHTFEEAEEATKNNKGSVLSLAVDYAGQDQELRMYKKMIEDEVKKVTPQVIEKYRDGGGFIPPADLIIRTSGEKRTSDLGWLSTNSELYFIEKLLPNTGSKDIIKALVDYSKRERRFGGRPAKQAMTNS